MMTMRLGTDARRAAAGSALWHETTATGVVRLLARLLGRSRVRGYQPLGTGHAVPENSDRAMCGVRPALLWSRAFDTSWRVVHPCNNCARRLEAGKQDRRQGPS